MRGCCREVSRQTRRGGSVFNDRVTSSSSSLVDFPRPSPQPTCVPPSLFFSPPCFSCVAMHRLSRSATCGCIILPASPLLCVKVSLSAALLSEIMRRFVRRVFVIAHHSAATLFVAQLFITFEEMLPDNSHAPSFRCSNLGTRLTRSFNPACLHEEN